MQPPKLIKRKLAATMFSILSAFCTFAAGASFSDYATPLQYIELPNLAIFTAENSKNWLLTAGENIEMKSDFKWTCPERKLTEPVLKLDFLRKDPALGSSQGSWVKLKRGIVNPDAWTEADGLCVILALEPPGPWWLAVGLYCGGESFTQPLQPADYTKEAVFESRLLPFSKFKGKTGFLSPNDIGKISAIDFSGVAPDGRTLYIKKIFLYKIDKKDSGLKFTTNKPKINIFERGEPVEFLFEGPAANANSQSLLVEVKDYFDREVWKSVLKGVESTGKISFRASVGELPSGYYDVKAWYLNASGARLLPGSCIAGSGSLEKGRGTFAVMPCTIAENDARRHKYEGKEFFGFHGSYLNLTELLGVSWRLGGSGSWASQEPLKPDRSSGMADWAIKKISQPNVSKPIDLHILNLGININSHAPKWAHSETPDKFPGLKDWSSFTDFFKDSIKVEKHLYPHMRNRIYDVAWEVDLNSPFNCTQKPVYEATNVVELYKRAKAIVDVEDKDGILMGPCTSNINSDEWLKGLFSAGLAKYVQAFNTHGYHAPPPEKSKVAERIRSIRALIRSFNDGRDMDIYCTELGYRSLYGMEDRHKEHAQWHVRVATILKGEGLKAYYPFYSFDFKDNPWGICYNLDNKFSFAPPAVSPKAAVPALAVCINQLEGATPLSDMPYFGSDVYAYIFLKDGEPLLAIWSVDECHKICLRAKADGEDESRPVEVVDIMGGHSFVKPENSCISLEVSPSILYVKGLSKRLYGGGVPAGDIVGRTYPGGSIKADISSSPSFIPGISVTKDAEGRLRVSVAETVSPGIYPFLDEGVTKWLSVLEPLDICGVKPCLRDGKTGIELVLSNKSASERTVNISIEGTANKTQRKDVRIPAASTQKEFFFFASPIPGKACDLTIEVKSAGMSPLRSSRKVNFLAARKRGEDNSNKLLNSIKWSGKGSSGRMDSASVTFEWDDKNLYLNIEVNDDDFQQARSDASIFMEDSIQLAFDTDPESRDSYNPFGGIYNKKISELAFALNKTSGEKIAWRHKTYDENQLKTGNVSNSFKMDFARNDKTGITRYLLQIPWREIGLDSKSVVKEKSIGIAILVNDKDSSGNRAGIELFGGILQDKNPSLYGTIILE